MINCDHLAIFCCSLFLSNVSNVAIHKKASFVKLIGSPFAIVYAMLARVLDQSSFQYTFVNAEDKSSKRIKTKLEFESSALIEEVAILLRH